MGSEMCIRDRLTAMLPWRPTPRPSRRHHRRRHLQATQLSMRTLTLFVCLMCQLIQPKAVRQSASLRLGRHTRVVHKRKRQAQPRSPSHPGRWSQLSARRNTLRQNSLHLRLRLLRTQFTRATRSGRMFVSRRPSPRSDCHLSAHLSSNSRWSCLIARKAGARQALLGRLSRTYSGRSASMVSSRRTVPRSRPRRRPRHQRLRQRYKTKCSK